jgi:hypothetical protein
MWAFRTSTSIGLELFHSSDQRSNETRSQRLPLPPSRSVESCSNSSPLASQPNLSLLDSGGCTAKGFRSFHYYGRCGRSSVFAKVEVGMAVGSAMCFVMRQVSRTGLRWITDLPLVLRTTSARVLASRRIRTRGVGIDVVCAPGNRGRCHVSLVFGGVEGGDNN